MSTCYCVLGLVCDTVASLLFISPDAIQLRMGKRREGGKELTRKHTLEIISLHLLHCILASQRGGLDRERGKRDVSVERWMLPDSFLIAM